MLVRECMIAFAQLRAFVKLGRPRFLVGGFVLFGLGTALAAVNGAPIDWQRYLLGQATITAAQSMTNYANDYFDLAADRANFTPTHWSGGSRVLVTGALAPHVALVAAMVLAAIAFSCSAALALRAGSPALVFPLAWLIIMLAWFYSAPPFRLLSRGLGEATTALVVTLLTPLFGYYVQTGTVRPLLLLACLPLCLLQFNMLLTIELPDAAGDRAQGKRTLVVRRGAAWAARSSIGLLCAAFGLLPVLFLLGLPPWLAAFAAAPSPLAVRQILRLSRGAYLEHANWDSLGFFSVLLVLSTSFAELVGAVLTLELK